MTHALIAGGGIAGLTTAIALQKAGLTSVVYEAYPAGVDHRGAFLSLFANGIDALRAIDAHRPVLDLSFPAERVEFTDGTGKQLGEARLARDDFGALPGPRTLRRADLCRALYGQAVSRGIRIEHGKRLATATTTPQGRVVAAFADGSTADGDLLIGADGVRSAVRRLIDSSAPIAKYTGEDVVCGYARKPPVVAPPETFRMIYGKRAFFAYLTTPDGDTWWFTNIPGAEPANERATATTPAQWRQRAVEHLLGEQGPGVELIQSTGDDVVGIHVYDVESTPVWYAGPMIVIGDAAHVASPNAGHGAAMAIEDAVVLAKCLRDLPHGWPAFSRYEQLRRDRVERLVTTSARMRRRAIPAPLQRVFRDFMLPRLLKRGPRNAAPWLTRHHIDWDESLLAD
ncbi:FAD-dependent oxidoreductase [Streptomyces sp. NPDC059010]|uniref:FAD-dependent oxidoreductase n=1 Tax=Streptomyces sp. NPDC059010 TaxID=3346695 RepID=UPI0036854B65